MAKTNDIIENPLAGERLQFLVTNEDSKGERLQCKIWQKSGGLGPPLHRHPLQSESIEVTNGIAGIMFQGVEQVLTAGQKIEIPANREHTYRNAGNEELEIIITLKPALRTESFFETIYSVARSGKVNKNGTPSNIFQFGAIMNEYYGEIFVVGPPVLAQKFLAKVIGGIAKLFGYKGQLK